MRGVVRNWTGLVAMLICGATFVGCGSTRPIEVYPKLDPADAAQAGCPGTKSRFFVGQVIDKRGYSDPRNVGFTQTGAFNVKASLLASPLPGELLRDSLLLYLRHCDLLASDVGAATDELTASLVRLQVSEYTGVFSEQIVASLQYEVILRDLSTSRRRRAFIEAQSTQGSSLDTTEFATTVIRSALRDSLGSLRFKLQLVGGRP